MVLKFRLSSFDNYCEMYHTITSTVGDSYLRLPSPTVLRVFNSYLYTLHKLCNVGIKSVYIQILGLSNFVINKCCLL